MIIISHRANLNGANKLTENNLEQIKECIDRGFDIEIDVWFFDGNFFLGHDKPQYEVSFEFLKNSKLWCHAKNKEALYLMLLDKNIHCFWHQKDDYTITSSGYIWAYPGSNIVNNSVAVMPETVNYSFEELKKCYAICTDKPIYYNNIFNLN